MSKFKVGDLVVCKVREFGNETVGKVYTVKTPNYRDNLFHSDLLFEVEKDDNGNPNSYNIDNFEISYIQLFNNKLEDLIKE